MGLLTARELIDDDHDVVIHARNPERLTGEVTEIVDKVRGVVYGDLDNVTGVETVAASANEYGAFDAVIHNAGSDNEQKTFAVNVVAPYVLSALMTRPKRIVTVSSVMHVNGSPEALPNAFATGIIDYSNSKLFVTALMMGLARPWPDGWPIGHRRPGFELSHPNLVGHRPGVGYYAADRGLLVP